MPHRTTAQADFADLPPELIRRLPRPNLPVAVGAWLGIRDPDQGPDHGCCPLAQALRDSYDAGQTFPFVAVILDCIDNEAQTFYRRRDFCPLPGHNNRLFLSWSQLQAMVTGR